LAGGFAVDLLHWGLHKALRPSADRTVKTKKTG
jgi:hypothetical protein